MTKLRLALIALPLLVIALPIMAQSEQIGVTIEVHRLWDAQDDLLTCGTAMLTYHQFEEQSPTISGMDESGEVVTFEVRQGVSIDTFRHLCEVTGTDFGELEVSVTLYEFDYQADLDGFSFFEAIPQVGVMLGNGEVEITDDVQQGFETLAFAAEQQSGTCHKIVFGVYAESGSGYNCDTLVAEGYTLITHYQPVAGDSLGSLAENGDMTTNGIGDEFLVLSQAEISFPAFGGITTIPVDLSPEYSAGLYTGPLVTTQIGVQFSELLTGYTYCGWIITPANGIIIDVDTMEYIYFGKSYLPGNEEEGECTWDR